MNESRININLYQSLIIGIFLIFSNLQCIQAKDTSVTQKPDSFKIINCYFTPIASLINITYRDFATSPLFYGGSGLNFGLGWMREMRNWENVFNMSADIASMSAQAPKSSYFETSVKSTFVSTQIYEHHLRRINKWSTDKYDVKLGGTFVSNFNVRINSSLQNNAMGIEALLNFMVAAKATKDISRKQQKVQNWFLFKRTVYPVKRNLSLQLNAGILNMNYRPGYAYIENGELNGTATNVFSYLFSGYHWKVNGWRLSTRLEFASFRTNGNGHKWAYLWDAASLPGRFEAFQMASHRLQYTLMFNYTKRKKI